MTNRRLRIVHVVSSLDARAGGTAMAAAGLAAAQVRSGLQVSIVATEMSGESRDLVNELIALGVKTDMIGPCSRLLRRHRQIVPTLQRQIREADVVHIHALWEEVQHQAAKISRRLGKPYVITPHGMLDPWSLSQSRLRKQLYLLLRMRRNLNRAAALHFTTEIERDLTAPLRLKAPAIVEPNGLDRREFDPLPPRGAFRARWPQLGDRPIVLFLSRVHPKKGLELLIPAFAASDRGRAALVIAGPADPAYQAALQEIIQRHGVKDDVFFTGMLHGAQRIEAMVDAELFVLPSYQENFGIAVAEALACGCPVIISDQVNIHPEISAAGVGAIVKMDVAQLTAEIARWLADDALRTAAASRARDFALQRYAWEQIADRWNYHYSRLCDLRPTR